MLRALKREKEKKMFENEVSAVRFFNQLNRDDGLVLTEYKTGEEKRMKITKANIDNNKNVCCC